MDEKYKKLLEDYSNMNEEDFKKILKKFGDVNSIEVKSSNDSSFVILSEEKENVYQIFSYDQMAKKIFNIINYMSKNRYQKINFEGDFSHDLSYEYNLYDYIPQLVSYIPENIIVWKKHVCLNNFNKEKIKEIICSNIIKLLWDIGLCLYILHSKGIIHGDVCIDNIGIANNKFILFDYDGSEIKYDRNLNYKDLLDFIKSIKFNCDNKWKSISKYIPSECSSVYEFLDEILYYEYKKVSKTYLEAITKLNNMSINI